MKKLFIKPFCIIGLIGITVACGKSQEDNFVKNTQMLKTGLDTGVSGQAISASDTDSVGTATAVSLDMFDQQAKLQVSRIGSYAGNKITISASHFGGPIDELSGSVSNWKIMDEAEAIIIDENGGVQFEWTPAVAGTYRVTNTMTSGEVEVSVSETLYVLDKLDRDADLIDQFWNFDEKLAGTWTGEIITNYGSSVHVDVIFSNDGSYELSRISQDEVYPRYPMEPHYMPRPMPFPSPPPEIFFREPFPPTSVLSFNKEKGSYELLDIWANGEVVGNMQQENYPPTKTENMTRIRFNGDYSMVFFELSFDPFFMGDAETVVLSRVSNVTEPPNLEIISEKLVGNWQGNVSTPWAMPYEVNFQFKEDGTYTAKSLTKTMLHDGEDLGMISPLYFGTTEPITEVIRYSIDKYVDNVASGDIIVELKTGELVTGAISNLEMSIDYSVLVFTFKHYGKYGPMRYVLERQ